MHQDEGRSVVGSLCICSPEDAPRSRCLATSVRLTPKTLTQLFIASPNNSLAVHLYEEVASVWGFLDAVPSSTLQLRVTGTGTLIASEDSAIIVVLEKGEILLPDESGTTSWTALLAKNLSTSRPFQERYLLAHRIQAVALAMHRHGHGGTLVVTPPTANQTDIPDIAIAHRFGESGTGSICSAIQKLAAAEIRLKDSKSPTTASQDTPELRSLLELLVEAHQQKLQTLLTNIGDLTRVDGAVALDTDLHLHGFGAKLSGTQEQFEVLMMDALTRSTIARVHFADLGGTRHQSAARYIYRNRDSLAIVASQDDHLTLFVWDPDCGEVLAIRRLEHFTWTS
jgi:hypothetical protein